MAIDRCQTCGNGIATLKQATGSNWGQTISQTEMEKMDSLQ